jgi:hypothetical protein
MPADVSAAAVVLSRQRRIGLRVALAVAAGKRRDSLGSTRGQ